MRALGRDVDIIKYSSIHGHDAFFVDEHFFVPSIRGFLSGTLLQFDHKPQHRARD